MDNVFLGKGVNFDKFEQQEIDDLRALLKEGLLSFNNIQDEIPTIAMALDYYREDQLDHETVAKNKGKLGSLLNKAGVSYKSGRSKTKDLVSGETQVYREQVVRYYNFNDILEVLKFLGMNKNQILDYTAPTFYPDPKTKSVEG